MCSGSFSKILLVLEEAYGASYNYRHGSGEQYASKVTAGCSFHIETRTIREALEAVTRCVQADADLDQDLYLGFAHE
jgi:hydroxymethylpyrimidine/phosphomethylpyrimidine kinase